MIYQMNLGILVTTVALTNAVTVFVNNWVISNGILTCSFTNNGLQLVSKFIFWQKLFLWELNRWSHLHITLRPKARSNALTKWSWPIFNITLLKVRLPGTRTYSSWCTQIRHRFIIWWAWSHLVYYCLVSPTAQQIQTQVAPHAGCNRPIKANLLFNSTLRWLESPPEPKKHFI